MRIDPALTASHCRHFTHGSEPGGNIIWQAAAQLFSSCTVVVEDPRVDLTDEALSRVQELLPRYTGGLAMFLGQKVSPDDLFRLMGIWPATDVLMRGYQQLPAVMRAFLRYCTPLCLKDAHIRAMKMPAALPAPAAADAASSGSNSGNVDMLDVTFRQFNSMDFYTCELLTDDAYVAAAQICQPDGNLQFHSCARATDGLCKRMIDAGVRLGCVRFWGARVGNLTAAGCKSLIDADVAQQVFLQQGCQPGEWIE